MAGRLIYLNTPKVTLQYSLEARKNKTPNTNNSDPGMLILE